MRIIFTCFHRRKNRGSLAIFFAEEGNRASWGLKKSCDFSGSGKIAAATAENRAILVHSDPETGIPKKCWRGCWHKCWQKWGCWPECWQRCWQAVLSLCSQRDQSASTCPSTSASPPIFASPCATPPASTFLEFPFWGPVLRGPAAIPLGTKPFHSKFR